MSQTKTKDSKSGVYEIVCVPKCKKYIGSSRDVFLRLSKHLYALRTGTHSNPHLQRTFNQYNKNAFIFRPIEFCQESELIERETFYINKCNTLSRYFGYNIRLPDMSRMSDETKERISIANKGKKKRPMRDEFRKERSQRMMGNKIGVGKNKGVREIRKEKFSEEDRKVIIEKRRLKVANTLVKKNEILSRASARKGRKFGPMSQATKDALSKSLKGTTASVGRVLSAETRAKIAASLRGRASQFKGINNLERSAQSQINKNK